MQGKGLVLCARATSEIRMLLWTAPYPCLSKWLNKIRGTKIKQQQQKHINKNTCLKGEVNLAVGRG